MASSGTLYTCPNYFRTYRIEAAANYSGFNLTKVTDQSAVARIPTGHVPFFEAAGGEVSLFEPNAIAYAVGNAQLRGVTAKAEAEVLQWVCWSDTEVLPLVATWVFPCLGVTQLDKRATDRAKEDVKVAMNCLNQHLRTRTFLVGERITQADITVACNLLLLYQHVMEPSYRAPYVNTNRWFNTVIAQPQIAKVVGEVVLCTKMAQFDGKRYAELHPKGAAGAADGASKKEAKPKPAKKEQPKKEVVEDNMDEDDAPPPAKEDKSPFAKFDKGNFDMDEFKRTYSNDDITAVAIPYFWDKFEADKYSLWYCEYKFPEELKLLFMSCNLVSGMFQRLDRLRKYGFGSVIVFGENNKSTISGLWFWLGQGLAFELSEDMQVDYESYEWKKLDPADPKTKELVTEYFLHEGNFDGKKMYQGKIFK